jgi:hypothetical protein
MPNSQRTRKMTTSGTQATHSSVGISREER